jgi:hypothetical protein
LFKTDLEKLKLMSGVQKIMLKKLEKRTVDELPVLDQFIIKPVC